MTNRASQAAERIAELVAEVARLKRGMSGIMSDCLTLSQLVVENERLLEERSEAREAARWLWKHPNHRTHEELFASWPWLGG